MNTYKITNITNLVNKRDFKFNSELEIEYIDGIRKKSIMVKPGNSVYFTAQSLPLSVHRLRIKNLITIEEVSVTELKKSIEKQKQQVTKPVALEDTDKKVVKQALIKKKSNKKEESIDSEVN